MKLFSLHQRFQCEGDDVELVWGHGLLSWNIQSKKILRPLLTTRLELQFKQMTSGKDGKRYGAYIYFCKGCRLRCNADELHAHLLENVLARCLLRSLTMNDSLDQEIKEDFTDEVESLPENIVKLEAQIDKYAVDMDRLEKEIKGMYKKDADEETQRLVKMMFQYRAALNKKLERAQQLVEEYNKKIDYIENVEMDYEFWKEIFFETIRTE